MLDSILSFGTQSTTSTTLKKRKHRGSDRSTASGKIEKIDLEYVYDVYYRDRAVHETWEKEKIGYM